MYRFIMDEIYVNYRGTDLTIKSYIDKVTTKFESLNITNEQSIVEEMEVEPPKLDTFKNIKIDRIYMAHVAIIEIEIDIELLNSHQLGMINELCLRYGVCDFRVSDSRKSVIVVYKSVDSMKELLKDKMLVINSIHQIYY